MDALSFNAFPSVKPKPASRFGRKWSTAFAKIKATREFRLLASLSQEDEQRGFVKSLRSQASKEQAQLRWKVLKNNVQTLSGSIDKKEIQTMREKIFKLAKEIKTVTECSASDSENIHIRKQGDLALYSASNLQKRLALKKLPRVEQMTELFWKSVPDAVRLEEIPHQTYIDLNARMHMSIVPSEDIQEKGSSYEKNKAEAYAAAEWDWNEDTDGGTLKMTKRVFQDSIFEVADTWTDDIDGLVYAAFIWRLIRLCFDVKDIAVDNEMNASVISMQSSRPFLSESLHSSPEARKEDTIAMVNDYRDIFRREHAWAHAPTVDVIDETAHATETHEAPDSPLTHQASNCQLASPRDMRIEKKPIVAKIKERSSRKTRRAPRTSTHSPEASACQRPSEGGDWQMQNRRLGSQLFAYMESKSKDKFVDSLDIIQNGGAASSGAKHGIGYISCGAVKTSPKKYTNFRSQSMSESLSPASGHVKGPAKSTSMRPSKSVPALSSMAQERSMPKHVEPRERSPAPPDHRSGAVLQRSDGDNYPEAPNTPSTSAIRYYSDTLKYSSKTKTTFHINLSSAAESNKEMGWGIQSPLVQQAKWLLDIPREGPHQGNGFPSHDSVTDRRMSFPF